MSRKHHEEGHRNTGDSAEEIQLCLSCTRAECVNCIGRSDPARNIEAKPVDRTLKLKPTDLAVLRAYGTSASDTEIAAKIGRVVSVVGNVRKKLGLPLTKDLIAEERVKIASAWLETVK